jgi:flagellar hook assembly protein FlgD
MKLSGANVTAFYNPHDIFNTNSTQTLRAWLSDLGQVGDAAGNWNLQWGSTTTPGSGTYGAFTNSRGWFQRKNATQATLGAPVDGCSTVADVANTNGSVVEATICRSVNDRFNTAYVDGSTMVTRYEVYLTAQNGVAVPRTLVAQFQPPSQGLTTDQNKFSIRFPVLPASSQTRTYAVVAVGGADIITAGKADFTPINASALELGSSLALDETANKAGDITSPLVTIGTVASKEETELAPAAVGKDLKIKDGTTGTNVTATLTKSADQDRVERQNYFGLLNITSVVEVPLVLGYNVYDSDNKLVATVSTKDVTNNADGTITFTFDAKKAGVAQNYIVKAFDGIQESTASNFAKGTAIGGGAAGDANGDGCISVVDLTFFAGAYGSTSTGDVYSTTFDFNNDGAINLVDYVAFAKVFKGTCSVAGKTETLETSAGKLTVEVQGNLAIVRLSGVDAQAVQFDVAAEGAKVTKVEDGNVFRGNSLSAYTQANGAYTYAVASTEGTVNGGVVAVINLDGNAKSVKLGNIQIVEKAVAKSTADVTAQGIPSEFALNQNYPNPFNPTTNINFSLPENVNVRLEVYDISGRLVQTLVSGQLNAGVHTITWSGQDNTGAQVASGKYLYRLQAGSFVQVKTMTLLK